MRICLVSREFVPFWGAGIGTYASQMAAAWAGGAPGQDRHEVHVVCPAYDNLAERGRALRPGVSFHGIDLAQGVAAWDAYRFAFLRHSMAVYLKLLELHERHAFDYIEFPEYWAEGYFALRGRQTLGHFEGAVLGVRLHTPTRDCRALNRQAWLNEEIAQLDHAEDESMRWADVLVSPSRSLLEKVRGRLELNEKPGHVVPYPFDVDAALVELGAGSAEGTSPVAAADPAGMPELLYFGRIEQRKGVHILIEAAQLLFEKGLVFRVRLVGRDTPSGRGSHGMLAHLKGLIQDRWKDRFLFEPARPREELGGLIRQSAACCFPSLWENFPNTCLEAMALSAVVIGSDAGGMAEIIEDGKSGVLFRSGDGEDLARAIGAVLEGEGLRRRIAAAAPARIRGLCEPAEVVKAMSEVIASSRTARGPEGTSHNLAEAAGATGGAPLISIIIPHYNLARYLPETIASAQRQTFREYEIIIVDDGSTDADSRELVQRIEKGHLGDVRVVRKANGGLASARNAGMAAAGGRWIVPLDAGDILAPNFLERTIGAAMRDPGLTVVTSLVCHFREHWGDVSAGWVPLGFERDMLPYTNCASCCTALIDRAAALEAGGYDAWLNPYEDWDLYCRLAGRGLRAAVMPEFLIGYRQRPTSMLGSQDLLDRASLRAYMYSMHAALSRDPDRTMRLQLAEGTHDAETRARELVSENIRYRVVDRMNEVLKRAGIQSRIKGVTRRLSGESSGL